MIEFSLPENSQMPLKIGVIYMGKFPPQIMTSAADRRVREIIRGINAQPDVELELWVAKRKGDPDIIQHEGITIRYFGGASRTLIGTFYGRLQFWLDILAYNKKNRPNWVLLYSIRIDGFLPAWLLRCSGTKIAAEFCDLRSVGSSQNTIKDRYESFLNRLDEIFIPRVTDLNIVISRYLENHVKKHAPKTKTHRLPILVDESLFRPVESAKEIMRERYGLEETAFLVTYLGGTWRHKGLAYLLEGFAVFVKSNQNARLLITGRIIKNNADHDDIEEISKKLNIYDRLILPGFVPNEDVALFYSRTNVLVLPHLNTQFAVAALPTKLAEYSITGKPIIATRVGDVPDYFEDGKDMLLVESEHADSIADALKRIANDTEFAKRLGSAARSVAEKYFFAEKALQNIVKTMKKM